MYTNGQLQQLQEQLVKSFQESIQQTQILNAFRTVPRHAFIEQMYRKQKGQWHLMEGSSSERMETIYTNKSLVTQIENNQPSSSSSQPSLMATMLDALDLQQGQRVLEIGTGTGYNAAVMAEIVGPSGRVISIDIDASLIGKARQRFDRLEYKNIEVYCAHGLDGYTTARPYDRIIATASFPYIPVSWLDQLAPDGLLVAPIQTPLAGALLKVTKGNSGRSAIGTFLDLPYVHFMPLRRTYLPSREDISATTSLPFFATEQCPFDTSIFDTSFDWLFWLHFAFPTARLVWYSRSWKEQTLTCPVLLDATMKTMLIFYPSNQPWSVEIRGEPQAWHRLQQVYSSWIEANRPSLLHYQFQSDASGTQSVRLNTTQHTAPLWFMYRCPS